MVEEYPDLPLVKARSGLAHYDWEKSLKFNRSMR
jgi:hypothetical protein